MTDSDIHGGLTDRALIRVRDFVDINLGEPITLEGMAGAACLSPCHFVRMFRRSTGQTPMHYLRRRRVEYAKRLLAGGGLSISEVALQAGFCDHSHLCRIFRQETGMSPGQYRQYTDKNRKAFPYHALSQRGSRDPGETCSRHQPSERMIYSSGQSAIMSMQ